MKRIALLLLLALPVHAQNIALKVEFRGANGLVAGSAWYLLPANRPQCFFTVAGSVTNGVWTGNVLWGTDPLSVTNHLNHLRPLTRNLHGQLARVTLRIQKHR